MSPHTTTDISPRQIKNADILRLYEVWQEAHGDADTPAITAMPVEKLWYHENLMLVESQADDYRYLHYREAIVHSPGFDMSGQRISDFKSTTGRFFRECSDRCI